MSEFRTKNGVVKHKNPGFIKKVVQALGVFPQIAIGFPRGKATSTLYPDGTPVVDVAVWNNYGTYNEDGSVAIPARPFLDTGAMSAVQETKNMRKALIREVRNGRIDQEVAANMIGAKASAIVKRTIRDWKKPPNAPSTIAKKKVDNPLVDTGLLMKTVTWDIREKKK